MVEILFLLSYCFPDCVFQSDRAAATRDVELLFSTSISVEAKLVEEKEIKEKKKREKNEKLMKRTEKERKFKNMREQEMWAFLNFVLC